MKSTMSFVVGLLLLESSTAWSQERESIQAKLQAAEIIPDVEYCTGDGHPLRLDMTRPKVPPDKPMPVVIYLHGGGWRGHKPETGTRFASRGFTRRSRPGRFSEQFHLALRSAQGCERAR